MRNLTLKKCRKMAELFIIEPLVEMTPNGKMGRTVRGETFYGYQNRRRKQSKKLSKPMQKAFRLLENAEKQYHRAMVLSILVPVFPVAYVFDKLDSRGKETKTETKT